jgi:HEPN domain-containing protein
MASSDLDVVRLAVSQQIGFTACRSKLAEVVEKIMKAGLIRLGWELERTHDLERLLDALVERKSDLVPILEPRGNAERGGLTPAMGSAVERDQVHLILRVSLLSSTTR